MDLKAFLVLEGTTDLKAFPVLEGTTDLKAFPVLEGTTALMAFLVLNDECKRLQLKRFINSVLNCYIKGSVATIN